MSYPPTPYRFSLRPSFFALTESVAIDLKGLAFSFRFLLEGYHHLVRGAKGIAQEEAVLIRLDKQRLE